MSPPVLVARLDNMGDVLLTGPAVRAMAGGGRKVCFLCGPRGRAAADLLPGLARVLTRAAAVVTGNTGPLHLAAAVGTPVVGVFPPTVPLERWRPWRVPHVVLGDQHVVCAGCRSRTCPLPTQMCLDGVTPAAVCAAVDELTGLPRRPSDQEVSR